MRHAFPLLSSAGHGPAHRGAGLRPAFFLLASAVLAATALVPATGSAAAAEQIRWLGPGDYDAARRDAAQSGKLVFVFVQGPNCMWCDHFKRTHLNDPAFQTWVNTLFIPIMANEGNASAAAWLRSQGWPGQGVPRFYILDGQGQLVGQDTGAARFPPMKALDVFLDLSNRPVPFPRDRLVALAKNLRQIKAPPDEIGRALVYAGMEALAWHWAGDPVMTRRAFGEKFERFLLASPPQRDVEPGAWDEIKLWYVKFWYDWVKDNYNHASAARVAESGAGSKSAFYYNRYAALLNARLGNWEKAKRYADAYERSPYARADDEFQQVASALKRRR